jgi:hypothetical protein
MFLPPMVPDAVAGGLSGGAFCWARRAVAVNSKQVQINVRFIGLVFLHVEPRSSREGSDGMIVALRAYVAKAASAKTLL